MTMKKTIMTWPTWSWADACLGMRGRSGPWGSCVKALLGSTFCIYEGLLPRLIIGTCFWLFGDCQINHKNQRVYFASFSLAEILVHRFLVIDQFDSCEIKTQAQNQRGAVSARQKPGGAHSWRQWVWLQYTLHTDNSSMQNISQRHLPRAGVPIQNVTWSEDTFTLGINSKPMWRNSTRWWNHHSKSTTLIRIRGNVTNRRLHKL